VLFDIRAQLERLRRGATGDYQELCNEIRQQMRPAGFSLPYSTATAS